VKEFWANRKGDWHFLGCGGGVGRCCKHEKSQGDDV